MKEVFQIAFAIIMSIGGGGAIVFALSSWLGKIWAQRIINKEELLNNYLLYSSQIQFEREYKIYSQIWLKMLNMKIDILSLDPILDTYYEDEKAHKKEYIKRRNKSAQSLNNLYEEIYSNAPFIDSDIYNALLEIADLSKKQLIEFETYKILCDNDERKTDEKKEYRNDSKALIDKTAKITEVLRTYLKKYKADNK